MTVFWGTHFAVPSQLAGLASSWSSATSWLTLTWTPYGGDPLLFWRYRVYRSIDAGVTWDQIDEDALADPTVGSFVDYDAPFGVALQYRVAMDNGAYEGAPATVANTMAVLGPYLATPADAAHSWQPLNMQAGGGRDPRSSKTVRYPMGRSSALVTSGPVRLPSGQVSFAIEWADMAQLQLFRDLVDYLADNAYVIWKPTAGETFRVQLSVSEAGPNVNGVTVGFTWWAVQ